MARWMLITIFLLITLTTYTYAQVNAVFDIFINAYVDKVELKSFDVIEGTALIPTQSGDYKLVILDFNNNTLYETSFVVQFELHEDVIINGERQAKNVTLDKVEVHLRVPFNKNADRLEIVFKNSKLLEHRIELCNNNKQCEPSRNENYFNCPLDCKSGSSDNYCDRVLDGVCDPDCSVKELDVDCTCGNNICDVRESISTCPKDCSKQSIGNTYPLIFGGIGILILGLVIFLLIKKKNKLVKR